MLVGVDRKPSFGPIIADEIYAYNGRMVVVSDPEVMWGTPVFEGTRVPAATLADYLAAGDTIEMFLGDYPEVSREQAEAFLHDSSERFIQSELKAA